MAHYFRERRDPPETGALTPDQWEAGLRAYGPRLIGAHEWLEAFRKERLGDAVCVTLDDGLACQGMALMVLKRMNLTAFVYVITETLEGQRNHVEDGRWVREQLFPSPDAFYIAWRKIVPVERPMPKDYLAEWGYLGQIEREFRWWRNCWATPSEYKAVMARLSSNHKPPWHWMTLDDLRAWSDTIIVGSHSHTHPWALGETPWREQQQEYARSLRFLSRHGLKATTISHPNGSYSESGLKWLRDYGIELGWASRMVKANPLAMPRYSTGYWRH